MKSWRVFSILDLVSSSVIFSEEGDTKKDEVREFVARWCRLRYDTQRVRSVMRDPRFVLTLDGFEIKQEP